MDQSTERIVAYAEALSSAQLTSESVQAAKQRLLDSVGCILGGFDSPPARIARQYARSISARPGARVLGDGTLTTPDVAAFANAVMLRYLDYNDTFISTGSLHPSDLIPAALAAAETAHASGADLLLGIVLGYEVAAALSTATGVRERGWDQGVLLAPACAMAAGKLLRLNHAQLGNALSLSLIPHVPLRQTRAGSLSMWKGCATADVARNALFAAQLAQLGLSGPPEPFEGEDGLWERVTGPFQFSLPSQSGTFAVQQTNLKLHPAEYHAQALLDLVPLILQRTSLPQIEAIRIETYWMCYSEIGADPAKWEPTTRETADHSLPFMLAVALRDGAIRLESFAEANLHDPELRALMRRISVQHNPEFTQRFPHELPSRLGVTTTTGATFTLDSGYPQGHFRKPATQPQLDTKFRSLAEGVVSVEQRDRIQSAVEGIEECADTATFVDTLVWS